MKTLKEQLIEVIQGKCAFGEYLINPEENDYLLVHCDYNAKYDGLELQACFDLPTYFSGEVIELNNGNIVIPFEPEYFEHIDHYLNKASLEIIEGYLIPNNIYYIE